MSIFRLHYMGQSDVPSVSAFPTQIDFKSSSSHSGATQPGSFRVPDSLRLRFGHGPIKNSGRCLLHYIWIQRKAQLENLTEAMHRLLSAVDLVVDSDNRPELSRRGIIIS